MIEIITIFVFAAVMAAVAAVDLRTRKIPDRLIRLVWCIAVLSLFTLHQSGGAEKLWGIFAAGVPMCLCAFLFPGKLGGGDCKLMAACGLFFGADRVLKVLFVSLLTAAAAGVVLSVHARLKGGEELRDAPACRILPLGPFFALGSFFFCWDLLRAIFIC